MSATTTADDTAPSAKAAISAATGAHREERGWHLQLIWPSVVKCGGSESSESLGIGCSSGEILINVYSTAEKTTKICEYGIPAQTVEGLTGHNQGSGLSSHLELGLKSLPVTVNVRYAKIAISCGGTTGSVLTGHYTGTLDGRASVEGSEAGLLAA